MKNIINTFLIGIAVVFAACEPIDDRKELGALLTQEQIDATVENTTPGGNELLLKCNNTNLGGYWDYGAGKTFNHEYKITYPYVGEFTFLWYATTAGGVVKKEVNVKIDKIDHDLEPEWTLLAGNTAAGKTWVYDKDFSGGGVFEGSPWPGWPSYNFMVDGKNWQGAWWDPAVDAGPGYTPGHMNEMKFDLNGGPNYTFYETSSSTGNKGTFILNTTDKTLKISDGVHIPDYSFQTDVVRAATNEYVIKVLNENQLVLWQDQRGGSNPSIDYGWVWIFKPKN